jgi:magnesium transporter
LRSNQRTAAIVPKPVAVKEQSQSDPGYEIETACLVAPGDVRSFDEAEIVRRIRENDGQVWLRVIVHDPEAAGTLLRDKLGFHELAVEDALSPHERPSLHEYGDHLFMTAARVDHSAGGERYTEVGFFLRGNALVTVAHERIPLMEAWFQRWMATPHRFGDQPAFLLHALVDAIVDEYFPVIDALEDNVDSLAERIYGGDTHQVRAILSEKRRFLDLRRHITPLRDILNGLLRRDIEVIPAEAKIYFQDVYDHTLRLAEIADLNRDTLTSVLDVHLSTVSNNLNEVVKKMTVISTVLMTGSLVAGIYGMNFRHMPELHWMYGYPFAIFLMFLLGAGILIAFRWKRWI